LLLVFGLIVIAGVYLYTRYQRKKIADSPQQDLFADRVEPKLRDSRIEPVLSDGALPEPADDEAAADVAEPRSEQKIVTVRIVARESGSFPGDQLVLSLRGIGLRHG